MAPSEAVSGGYVDAASVEFSEWYEETAPAVTRILALTTGDRALAEEAVAEAYARAWDRWRSVRRMDQRTGWVVRVARNLVVSRARRNRTADRAKARVARAEVEPSTPTDPDLWNAVGQLPDRMRWAVALKYVADLPEAEIARAMGITRGTVASTLHDARRRLADELGAREEER